MIFNPKAQGWDISQYEIQVHRQNMILTKLFIRTSHGKQRKFSFDFDAVGMTVFRPLGFKIDLKTFFLDHLHYFCYYPSIHFKISFSKPDFHIWLAYEQMAYWPQDLFTIRVSSIPTCDNF